MSQGNGRGLLDRVSYVLLAVFVLITLGPALIGMGTLFDVDALTRFAPFSGIAGVDLNDTITCRTDTINGFVPAIHAIKSGFWSGDFRTWSPYVVGGVPLASLPNQGELSPLSLPYYFLPLWLAPAFVKLGEFSVAIGGMFAFLRRHGLSRGASVLAGIIFVSSGFMMMWTNWPQTRVAAFIPALFWGLERMVQRRSPRDVVLVAAVVASMLLGGFPAVTLYTFAVAAVYVVVRALTVLRPDRHAMAGLFVRAGSGVLLGIGLSAIQILPFVRNLGALGLQERETTAGVHLPLGLFTTTVAPDSVGLCVGGQSYGSVVPIEAVGFLGAAAVVLALCALVVRLPVGGAPDRSPRVFLAVALVVLVVLIWVGGPLLGAVQRLPLFSSNSITRAQSVFGFLGAALAGVGIDRLLRWISARRGGKDSGSGPDLRAMVPALAVLAVAVVFFLLVLVRGGSDAHRLGYAGHWWSALIVPGLFLVAAVVAALLTRFGPSPAQRFGPFVLALLVVAQSTMFAHTMLPLSHRSNLYPATPTQSYLQRHLDGERFGASGVTLYPAGSASFYGLRTPVGHEFTQPRWWDVLLAVDPKVRVSPTYSLFPQSLTAERSASLPALDQLAVRYWVGASSDVAGTVDPTPAAPDRVRLKKGERGHCEIDGGALRGVQVVVQRPRNLPLDKPTVIHVAVHTPSGVQEGQRLLGKRLPAVPTRVAVPGEGLSGGGSYPVDVWVTGARGATVFKGQGGDLACSGVRPTDDGLRLVFAEAGDTVYERLSAFPRIRWADRSRVVADADERVRELKRGVAEDTVLLDDDSTPAADG